MPSAATTRAWTTCCSSQSPSGGRRRRSIASPRSSPRVPDELDGMKLIYEKSQPGRRASLTPRYDSLPPPELPRELRRSEPPRLPEVPEFELVRHFTELSTRNFGVDTG